MTRHSPLCLAILLLLAALLTTAHGVTHLDDDPHDVCSTCLLTKALEQAVVDGFPRLPPIPIAPATFRPPLSAADRFSLRCRIRAPPYS